MKQPLFRALLTNRDIELFIAKQLRYGVLLAYTITFIGGILYLIQHQGEVSNYTHFTGASEYLRSFKTMIPQILVADGAAIIQLGVIILISTPILRVCLSAMAFAIENDRLYVCISLLVLMIILANMLMGLL